MTLEINGFGRIAVVFDYYFPRGLLRNESYDQKMSKLLNSFKEMGFNHEKNDYSEMPIERTVLDQLFSLLNFVIIESHFVCQEI